jgi:hypothetical protein
MNVPIEQKGILTRMKTNIREWPRKGISSRSSGPFFYIRVHLKRLNLF